MYTEEELIELMGTDSDGEPIDLSARPPSLEKVRSEQMFAKSNFSEPMSAPRDKTQVEKAIDKGYRVDTEKVGPSGTRLFLLKVPI